MKSCSCTFTIDDVTFTSMHYHNWTKDLHHVYAIDARPYFLLSMNIKLKFDLKSRLAVVFLALSKVRNSLLCVNRLTLSHSPIYCRHVKQSLIYSQGQKSISFNGKYLYAV